MMATEKDEVTTVRVITGSGRSGTTWILDALAAANNMRTVFEPMKTVTRRVPSYENAYLPRGHSADDLEAFLHQVFAGHFHSIWTDYRVLPERLSPFPPNVHSWGSFKGLIRRFETLIRNRQFYSKQFGNPFILVKFIRANLMIEWLQEKFNAKVIFVMRHPGAVIESQLRLGGDSWDPYKRLAYYQNSPLFMRDLGERYGTFLEKSLTPAQANTLIWCIENQYPLERASPAGYAVFTYEQLMAQPQQQWARVCDALQLSATPDDAVLNRPSQQASDAWKTQSTASSSESRWMKRLEKNESAQIQDLLDELGVDAYRMDNPQPLKEFGS